MERSLSLERSTFISVEVEQRWCDTDAVHIEPAIVGQISVEITDDSIQTAVVPTASIDLAVTQLHDTSCSHVYQSDIQDLLSSGIAHGIRIGAKRKVARVNDARMLRELLDGIEPRAEILARWDSWVLEYNLPIVVLREPAQPPDVRCEGGTRTSMSVFCLIEHWTYLSPTLPNHRTLYSANLAPCRYMSTVDLG